MVRSTPDTFGYWRSDNIRTWLHFVQHPTRLAIGPPTMYAHGYTLFNTRHVWLLALRQYTHMATRCSTPDTFGYWPSDNVRTWLHFVQHPTRLAIGPPTMYAHGYTLFNTRHVWLLALRQYTHMATLCSTPDTFGYWPSDNIHTWLHFVQQPTRLIAVSSTAYISPFPGRCKGRTSLTWDTRAADSVGDVKSCFRMHLALANFGISQICQSCHSAGKWSAPPHGTILDSTRLDARQGANIYGTAATFSPSEKQVPTSEHPNTGLGEFGNNYVRI